MATVAATPRCPRETPLASVLAGRFEEHSEVPLPRDDARDPAGLAVENSCELLVHDLPQFCFCDVVLRLDGIREPGRLELLGGFPGSA